MKNIKMATKILSKEKFKSLKGETEAEGLLHSEIAAEVILAARNDLGYLVKISGAEALGDIRALERIGIREIVCPMVETEFAMSKYMGMVENRHYDSIGVTIETKTAVSNIDEILNAGNLLTEVTIGRSDLCRSLGGISVDSDECIHAVKLVARKARSRGLHVTMGGSVSSHTIRRLQGDKELLDLVDFVETRKVVIRKSCICDPDILQEVFEVEKYLINFRLQQIDQLANGMRNRISEIEGRK